MRKCVNKSHVAGVLYEHNLQAKVTGKNSQHPDTPFINGTISIATDEAMTNIVQIHWSYCTEYFNNKKVNNTYGELMKIINGEYATYMNAKEGQTPVKIRCDSAIGLNDFYTNRNGEIELVSAKRNEGGFIHIGNDIDEDEENRSTFDCDMLITAAIRREADEERGIPEKLIVKGAIFDFRNSLLPVEFSATNPVAMDYFEGLEPSNKNPVFTHIWGKQVSEVIVRKIEEESAFGESRVREVKNSRKDFVITGAAREPYLWDDESTMTVEDLKKAIGDREVYLATVKQRHDDYQAQKSGGGVQAPVQSSFDF